MRQAPIIHKTRNKPTGVRFAGDMVCVDMADGRAICMPISWFPWLEKASAAQRNAYRLVQVSVIWEDLDEGIDMVAMLTGLYIGELPRPVETFQPALEAVPA